MKCYTLFLFSFFLTSNALDRAKLAIRPRSQPGFILEKGKWYLQARLKPCSWSGSDEFEEWIQLLSMRGSDILAKENWYNRVCTETSAVFIQNQKGEGCFTVKDSFGDVWSGENVVVATDYKSFSITRGCTKPSVDGKTCVDTYVTVKTRTPFPKPRTWKVVEAILKKLFDLSLTEMKRISHKNPQCLAGSNSVGPSIAPSAGNLVQVAEMLGATALLEFATEAGLAETLSNEGPVSTLAPTNAAFEAVPGPIRAELSRNTGLLRKVLLFHVLEGEIFSNQLSNDLLVPTLAGRLKVRINIYGKIVTANGAKIIDVDKKASNGVIHVIDRVMFPLPTGPIPSIVADKPVLSTLLIAVEQARLVGALKGKGPFTLFAPSNEAFDGLRPGVLDGLLANTRALADVLKYHVVPATVYSAGITSGPVTTLLGRDIHIRVTPGGIKVNDAKVITADIPATNGVVHIIDCVLLPK